jgi:ABC-type Fe3+/spermidine/putrescine transport system ATPase subunit
LAELSDEIVLIENGKVENVYKKDKFSNSEIKKKMENYFESIPKK